MSELEEGILKNLTSINVRKKGIQPNRVSQESVHLHWLVQWIRWGKTKPAQGSACWSAYESTEKDLSLVLQKRKWSSQNVICDLLCFLIWKSFYFVVPSPFSSNHRHKAEFQNSRVRVFGFTIFLNHNSSWKRVFSKQHKTYFSLKTEDQQLI